MRNELLEKLSRITSEERQILANATGVDYTLYSYKDKALVDRNKLLPVGHQIGMRTHTRFVHFPPHKHNYIELIYMCAGETTHIIGGDERITLSSGELLLLNQEVYHEILPAKREDIAVNFIVLPQFFDASLPTLQEGNPLWIFLMSSLRHSGTSPAYLLFHVADVLPVQNLLENLVYSLLQGGTPNNEIERQTMNLLLRHLAACTDRLNIHTEADRRHALVMRVLHSIEDDFRTCTLSQLAEQEGVSDYTLSRMIREQTGTTFTQLLQTVRFQRAAYLLRETDLSVAEITAAIGYENTAFFYRNFAQRYGCTPKEYRLSAQQEEATE